MIKAKNNYIYYKQWDDKKIIYVNGLLDKQDNFLFIYKFLWKTPCSYKLIEYYSIIKVVIKLIINGENFKPEMPPLPSNIEIFCKTKRGVDFLWYFQSRNREVPVSQQKWDTLFEHDKLNWKCIFKMPFKYIVNKKF